MTIRMQLSSTRKCRAAVSLWRVDKAGANALTSNKSRCVKQTRRNIVRLEPWIALQYCLPRISGREQAKYMLDSQPMTANDWFATEYFGIGGNSFEEGVHLRQSR